MYRTANAACRAIACLLSVCVERLYMYLTMSRSIVKCDAVFQRTGTQRHTAGEFVEDDRRARRGIYSSFDDKYVSYFNKLPTQVISANGPASSADTFRYVCGYESPDGNVITQTFCDGIVRAVHRVAR